jgi:hypothetical protein
VGDEQDLIVVVLLMLPERAGGSNPCQRTFGRGAVQDNMPRKQQRDRASLRNPHFGDRVEEMGRGHVEGE